MQGHRAATLSVDGRNLGELGEGDAVVCTAAARSARLVTFGPRDFLRILKAKFGLERPVAARVDCCDRRRGGELDESVGREGHEHRRGRQGEPGQRRLGGGRACCAGEPEPPRSGSGSARGRG